jgi:hypothetical protein
VSADEPDVRQEELVLDRNDDAVLVAFDVDDVRVGR